MSNYSFNVMCYSSKIWFYFVDKIVYVVDKQYLNLLLNCTQH